MLLGTLLLVTTLAALLVGLFAASADLLRPAAGHARLARRATWLATGSLTAALVLLAYLFIKGDVSVSYVWRNIDTAFPWHQRLSGLWVGREGSLLLWTFAVLLFWSLDERRHVRALRRGTDEAVRDALGAGPHHVKVDEATLGLAAADVALIRRVARPFLLGFVALLLAVVMAEDLFGATGAGDLAGAPDGRGVNPQLITFYNTIHPPVVLTGYALVTLPTAFALAHFVTGRPGWIGPARRWSHLAFLVLTIGITLGALWAYVALGWGGYWAWDPVEVGILVPWIATTAFIHAGMRHDQKGEFPVAAPALAFLMLPTALFSTFIVRAGGIWVSVHSFLGAGDATNALDRFLNAFATSLEVQLYSLLLAVSLLAIMPLLWLHVGRIEEGTVPGGPKGRPIRGDTAWQKTLSAFTLRRLFLLGVLALTLLGTVTVTVLFVGINGFANAAVREAIFETRTGPVALTAVLLMSLAISFGMLSKRAALAIHGGALVLGAAAGLVMFPDQTALAMAGTLLAVAAALATMRIIQACRILRPRHAMRIGGTHLVHLGVIVVLLGHGVVSEFTSEEEIVELAVGETRQVGDDRLTLDHIERGDPDGDGRYETVFATLLIDRDDADPRTVTVGFTYFGRTDHYKPDVGIDRTVARDHYFAPRGIHDPDQGWIYSNLPLFQQNTRPAGDVDGVSLGVSTLPSINLVWAGAAFMTLGAVLITATSWSHPTGGPETAATRRAAAKTGDDAAGAPVPTTATTTTTRADEVRS